MGAQNYESIIRSYLHRAFGRGRETLRRAVPSESNDRGLIFKAFGKRCCASEEGIILDDAEEKGALGVLISIYLLYVPEIAPTFPSSWKAFRDFPDTMPYWGAFRANAEEPLVPFVEKIFSIQQVIYEHFDGQPITGTPGDFSFVVFPFPKLPLLYIFYLPDEEFPAEVRCLFPSENNFMPVDALADVAEYTGRLMVDLAVKGDIDGK